jgi:hypothetical protein
MPRVLAVCLSAVLAMATLPARADDTGVFMKRFSGAWIGSGHLLVGTETGLDFACNLSGDPDATKLTFEMSGTCRMGTLSAPINAKLRYNADTRQFYGDFMGGAQGDGVDLVGARAGEGFSLKLVRGATQGRLSAQTLGKSQMKVIIYLKDPNSTNEMPVVAMGFTRREVITGSIAP